MSMFKRAPEEFMTVVEEGADVLLLLDDSFPKDDPSEEFPFRRPAEHEFKGGKKSTGLLPGLLGGQVVGSKGNAENTRLDKSVSEEKRAEEKPRSPATLFTLSFEGIFSFKNIESMESTRVAEDPLDKVDEGESNNSIKPELDLSSNPESFINKDLEGKEDKVSEYRSPKSDPDELLSFVK
jgi:hypothetical protein